MPEQHWSSQHIRMGFCLLKLMKPSHALNLMRHSPRFIHLFYFNTLLLHLPPPPPTLFPLYNLMQWMIHRSWQNNACCSFLNRFALCPLPRHTAYYVPGFVLRLLTFVLIMLLCILNPWNVLPMNYEMTDTWESLPTHPP